MSYARIINSVAVDVSSDPAKHFHPQIAAEFEAVPAEVRPGWRLEAETGEWSAPAAANAPEQAVIYPVLTPLDFKMCLTVQERLAAKELAASDPVLADFFFIIEDPRLTQVDLGLQSVRDAVAYLFGKLVEGGTVNEADKDTRIAQVQSGTRI